MMKYSQAKLKIAAILIAVVMFFGLFSAILFNKTVAIDGRIYINKEVNASFLSNLSQENFLVYFGYVGCVKVCTPILQQLSSFYETEEMKRFKNNTAVVFINLTPDITKEQPQLFATAFNDKFAGLYLSRQELFNIDRRFGLFYSQGVVDKDELSHSDSIYYVRKENGKIILKSIYSTHPLNTKAILDDILGLK